MSDLSEKFETLQLHAGYVFRIESSGRVPDVRPVVYGRGRKHTDLEQRRA